MADKTFLIGKSPEGPVALTLKRANRHGLIAGATGTGKTVTLQTMAEAFSHAGVAVFAADVKGDLSGIAAPGDMHERWVKRAAEVGVENYTALAAPVVFWDVYGQQGHPVRTTVSEMGPLMLSRILDLSEAQDGALTIAFKMADEMGLLLLDLKDLRSVLTHVAENAEEIGKKYGLVSAQTIAAMQRKLLQLEMDGADAFFGEPALELADMIRTTADGKGVVNLLCADKLIQSPRLYATFLLWLMSELWEELPEAGDLDKPKMVFFFDEAHLLFNDAPKALLDRIEQVARLIRSKGVGIYFITQSPTDIPDNVLAQLGNRVQHALRAYTPSDQKAVRAAAQSFRANPGVDVAKEIQELAVGEALVSTLDEKGAPTPVARTMVRPPCSRVGPVTADERARILAACAMGLKYKTPVDRESAYEILTGRAAESAAAAEAEKARTAEEKAAEAKRIQEEKAAATKAREEAKRMAALEKEQIAAEKLRLKEEAIRERQREQDRAVRVRTARRTTSAVTRTAERVGGNVLSTIGRELVRGIFGNMKKRR
ncbi:MAG: helicase HerA-like domain-containing protein [Hyphomonadaceae bacterium]|nr:helicase HerA-like domain-containing protein [Hyphomonadaceae bacterium]